MAIKVISIDLSHVIKEIIIFLLAFIEDSISSIVTANWFDITIMVKKKSTKVIKVIISFIKCLLSFTLVHIIQISTLCYLMHNSKYY